MPAIILFIIIAIAVAISNAGTILKEKEVSQPQQQTKQQIQTIAPQTKTKPLKEESAKSPTISIDTFIKYGPLEREIIEDTNKIVFEFRAEVSPEETEGRISFETKLEGFDDNWEKTYSKERTINLTPGTREYTFLVRAKINDIVDPTPAKRTFKLNVSPYFAKVKFYRVEPPTFYKPSLIRLTVNLGRDEKINITGWEIEGKNGIFVIPQGVEKYDSLNPLFNQDIFIKQGDRIYVSSKPSPFWGQNGNFRPNKCMGYLVNSNDFTISISQTCPKPRKDRLPHYLSQRCQDYINSRGSCELLEYERLKEWEIFNDSNCMSYVSFNFSYPGCLINYSQDEDFLKKEWHIYMNKREKEIMDREADTIYLRDQNGLFIDKYHYGEIQY